MARSFESLVVGAGRWPTTLAVMAIFMMCGAIDRIAAHDESAANRMTGWSNAVGAKRVEEVEVDTCGEISGGRQGISMRGEQKSCGGAKGQAVRG